MARIRAFVFSLVEFEEELYEVNIISIILINILIIIVYI